MDDEWDAECGAERMRSMAGRQMRDELATRKWLGLRWRSWSVGSMGFILGMVVMDLLIDIGMDFILFVFTKRPEIRGRIVSRFHGS